jgi:hypothetical protein
MQPGFHPFSLRFFEPVVNLSNHVVLRGSESEIRAGKGISNELARKRLKRLKRWQK